MILRVIYTINLLIITGFLLSGESTLQEIGNGIANAENNGNNFIESEQLFADIDFAFSVYKKIEQVLPESDRGVKREDSEESIGQQILQRKTARHFLLTSIGKKSNNDFIKSFGNLKFMGGVYVPIGKYTNNEGDGVGIAVLTFVCSPIEGKEVIFTIAPECLKLGSDYKIGEFSPWSINIIR